MIWSTLGVLPNQNKWLTAKARDLLQDSATFREAMCRECGSECTTRKCSTPNIFQRE
jgi:hypothetical protein